VEQVEEPLFALDSGQFGADPGMLGQTPEIFRYHSQRNHASVIHENRVPRYLI
jgi:hypothetical protein